MEGKAGAGSKATVATLLDPTGKYKVVHDGAFSCVEVAITPTDSIKGEAGGMLTLSNNVDFQTRLEGSIANGLLLCCCAGESMWMTHYFVKPGGGARGDVLIAPAVPGEIAMLHVQPQHAWSVQQCGFVACDSSVEVGVRLQRLSQCLCAGEGWIVLKCTGMGRLLVNSFGSICKYELAPGERRTVDNGALVAWSDHMQPEIKLAAEGVLAAWLSNEGFVCTFTGPGVLYVQTRAVKGLGQALAATGLRRTA